MTSVFVRRDTREPLLSFLSPSAYTVERPRKDIVLLVTIYKPGRELSAHLNLLPPWPWTSSLQELWENKHCLNDLTCGIMSWQPEKTNINVYSSAPKNCHNFLGAQFQPLSMWRSHFNTPPLSGVGRFKMGPLPVVHVGAKFLLWL